MPRASQVPSVTKLVSSDGRLGRRRLLGAAAAAGLALVVAFIKAPGAMLAMALVIAALLQAGAVSASAIPGVDQVNQGWVAAKHWKDHQIEVASCRNRQFSALSAGDTAALDAVEQDCA